MRRRIGNRFKAILREARGNVTVEFGFLIPILVILAVGTVDFGRLGLQKIAVTNAARAATQYGTQDLSTAGDIAGMRQAAYDDYGDDGTLLTVTPRQYCTCPSSSTEIACNTLCTGGEFPYTYVEVTVSRQLDFLIPYPGVQSPRQVTSTNTMRFR